MIVFTFCRRRKEQVSESLGVPCSEKPTVDRAEASLSLDHFLWVNTRLIVFTEVTISMIGLGITTFFP